MELEYDEEISTDLILQEDHKIGSSQFTSDNLIDEDFESELASTLANLPLNQLETEAAFLNEERKSLREHIDQYGIVKVCGSDLSGRPIILFSACNLPDAADIVKVAHFDSHQHFFDILLDILASTLERYVESEYTLVYLHYGLQSSRQPSFQWLVKVYKMLDRKFKKNLKALFIVHPTFLIKVLWGVFTPLISSKFNKKVTYCTTLAELSSHMDLKSLAIPETVKNHDAQLKMNRNPSIAGINSADTSGPFQQFKVSLDFIAKQNNGDCVPLVLKETMIYLRQHFKEEGIFRKSGSLARIREIQNLYNQGLPAAYDQYEVHVAACVFKSFFRELPESLLSESIINEIMALQALDLTDQVDVIRDLVNTKLPKNNYIILKCLVEFLSEVAQHSAENKMDAKNLSYVFGPNFLRTNPVNNVENSGLIDVERINSFFELLIRFNAEIFANTD